MSVAGRDHLRTLIKENVHIMRMHLTITGPLAAAGAALLSVAIAAPTLATSATWTRQFGTAAEDVAGGLPPDAAGSTVVGTAGGPLVPAVGGANDAFVRRYNRSGTILW